MQCLVSGSSELFRVVYSVSGAIRLFLFFSRISRVVDVADYSSNKQRKAYQGGNGYQCWNHGCLVSLCGANHAPF